MKLKLLMGLSIMLAASAAFAGGYVDYAGVEMGHTKLDQFPQYPGQPSDNTYKVFAGKNVSDNLAAEVGIGDYGSMRGMHVQGVDATIVPSLRVSPKAKLYTKIGVADTRVSYGYWGHADHLGMAAGFGGEYAINNNWSLKAEMMRYNGVGKDIIGGYAGSDMTTTNVGVKYTF